MVSSPPPPMSVTARSPWEQGTGACLQLAACSFVCFLYFPSKNRAIQPHLQSAFIFSMNCGSADATPSGCLPRVSRCLYLSLVLRLDLASSSSPPPPHLFFFNTIYLADVFSQTDKFSGKQRQTVPGAIGRYRLNGNITLATVGFELAAFRSWAWGLDKLSHTHMNALDRGSVFAAVKSYRSLIYDPGSLWTVLFFSCPLLPFYMPPPPLSSVWGSHSMVLPYLLLGIT